MKKVIIWTMLLFTTAASFCQETTPLQPLTATDYLQKSKNQKSAAWVLLGGGAVIDIIAIATFPKDYIYLDIFGESTNSHAAESKANTSAALFLVGSAAMLSSIPLFIASRKNNKRAVSITMDGQKLRQLKGSSFHTVNYPALTMKISL